MQPYLSSEFEVSDINISFTLTKLAPYKAESFI
jgi:hypothetical protein